MNLNTSVIAEYVKNMTDIDVCMLVEVVLYHRVVFHCVANDLVNIVGPKETSEYSSGSTVE